MEYHATMIDETGCEFGYTMDVDPDVTNVTEYFREMFPESTVVLVEPVDAPSSKAKAYAVWEQRWDDDTWDLY